MPVAPSPSLQWHNTAGAPGSVRRTHLNYSEGKATSSVVSLIILPNFSIDTGTSPKN